MSSFARVLISHVTLECQMVPALYYSLFIYIFVTVLLCNFSWPGSHCVDKVNLGVFRISPVQPLHLLLLVQDHNP